MVLVSLIFHSRLHFVHASVDETFLQNMSPRSELYDARCLLKSFEHMFCGIRDGCEE